MTTHHPNKTVNNEKAPPLRVSWHTPACRALVFLLGAFLFMSSLSKIVDMELFTRQIKAYGILESDGMVALAAWAVVTIEWFLAMGLLLCFRTRLVLLLTAYLLTAFTGLMIWAWASGAVEDCGCFGRWIPHAPGQKALENLFLLILTIGAWRQSTPFSIHGKIKTWAMTATCTLGLALSSFMITHTLNHDAITTLPATDMAVDITKTPITGIDGLDLHYGNYLIVLMGTDCDHCQEAIPSINTLADECPLTTVVALCPNEECERIEFIERFHPSFPLGQVSEETFWDLLSDGMTPRFFLLSDGHIQRVWDGTPPNREEVDMS